MRDFGTIMAGIHLFEKCGKLIIAEDMGNVSGAFRDGIFGKDISMHTDTSHIHSQLPYDTNPVL
jgi:hypothetical protein